MSKDKFHGVTRRNKLLRRAAECFANYNSGIAMHCEGGMAMDNPDIKKLVADGHLEFYRKLLRESHTFYISSDRERYPAHWLGPRLLTLAMITKKGALELAL